MNLHLVDGVKKTTKKGESTRINEARIKGVSIAGIKMSPQVLEDYARDKEMTKKMQCGKPLRKIIFRATIFESVQDTFGIHWWGASGRLDRGERVRQEIAIV
jgi:hypothetical protein